MGEHESQKHIRILCLGDSLTAGYHSWGMAYHPYANRMENRLKHRWPSKTFDITVDGVPGDTVVNGTFLNRLEHQLAEVKQRRYDWIIVLGGTNDIGWGLKPAEIVHSLEEIWNKELESGATVLALNVAASRVCDSAQGRARLEELNGSIVRYDKTSFFSADLYALVPWPSDDEEEQDRIWDDGLHFTPAGYDMMGEVVADRLIDLLS